MIFQNYHSVYKNESPSWIRTRDMRFTSPIYFNHLAGYDDIQLNRLI